MDQPNRKRSLEVTDYQGAGRKAPRNPFTVHQGWMEVHRVNRSGERLVSQSDTTDDEEDPDDVQEDSRPPYFLVTHFTSDIKLEKLLFPSAGYEGQSIILVGDVLRMEYETGRKEVQVILSTTLLSSWELHLLLVDD
jgi:hypothetical protein